MNTWALIALAEWRFWARSRLALAAAALLGLLLVATTVLTTLRLQADTAARLHLQAQAEAAFLSQPDRHPHRMVHYGHYVFRPPAPLARLDPGLDPVTGQALFLEGHRQNSAMFAASAASAHLGVLGPLSPVLVLQLFGPLLLVLLGHGLLAREREAGTLATLMSQGLGGSALLAGKALALGALVLVLLLPLGLGAAAAVAAGEPPVAALALLAAHGLYLMVWVGLVLLATALLQRRAAVLACLSTLWVGLSLVLPALAAGVAASAAPMPGQLEANLAMLTELRQLGDGHNANDPAFARLRADLMQRHGVQRAEDLPLNLRGLVAQHSERQLTQALNRHARAQRAGELRQAEVWAWHGWFSPPVAVAEASRALAGTDLAHHHRFLEAAEALRYSFVQGLNRLHAERLAYADDVRRSSDPEAERRTRISADSWRLLQRFQLVPEPAWQRLGRAWPAVAMLCAWALVLGLACAAAGRRLRP